MKTKNMRNILLFGLYFGLALKEVFGESEYEVKRGTYAYMAVVYYPDVTILGPSDVRFSRSAIIIKPDWLISSSLETNDTQLAFPLKTLVARAGAIVIDSNFTINEEEDEQEQEIIQVVRPANFTISQWWNNDITLLKTLLPFVMTPTVALTTLATKRNYLEKTCSILVFAKKYKNSTDDKLLMQLTVELLPTTKDNCGVHFRNETMICASNSEDNKNIVYESDFCLNNGGGPLICEGDVIGLQTYINNNCKSPYLYQMLSAWDDFITCGVEDKCRLQQCANICTNIDKDVEVTLGTNDVMTIPTSETAKDILVDHTTEDSNDEEHLMPDTTIQKVMIVNENETPTPTTLSTTEVMTPKDTTPRAITESEEKTTSITEDSETGWPKEKLVGYRKKLDEAESSEYTERPINVEAQRHEAKKKRRNAAENYVVAKMGLIYNLVYELLFFICII